MLTNYHVKNDILSNIKWPLSHNLRDWRLQPILIFFKHLKINYLSKSLNHLKQCFPKGVSLHTIVCGDDDKDVPWIYFYFNDNVSWTIRVLLLTSRRFLSKVSRDLPTFYYYYLLIIMCRWLKNLRENRTLKEWVTSSVAVTSQIFVLHTGEFNIQQVFETKNSYLNISPIISIIVR